MTRVPNGMVLERSHLNDLNKLRTKINNNISILDNKNRFRENWYLYSTLNRFATLMLQLCAQYTKLLDVDKPAQIK